MPPPPDDAGDPGDAEIVHLPPEVMKRVMALSEVQKKRDAQFEQYQAERKVLELKYAAIYADNYKERAGEMGCRRGILAAVVAAAPGGGARPQSAEQGRWRLLVPCEPPQARSLWLLPRQKEARTHTRVQAHTSARTLAHSHSLNSHVLTPTPAHPQPSSKAMWTLPMTRHPRAFLASGCRPCRTTRASSSSLRRLMKKR